MYTPTRTLPAISPARSTPSLEPDGLDYSPPDDYLATPDLSEWKEVRRLEDQRIRAEAKRPAEPQFVSPLSPTYLLRRNTCLCASPQQYDLPTLDILSQNQRPLFSELPPTWPHSTIAPKDAFYDYQEVRRFLQEQARPTSPSVASSDESSTHPYDNDPFCHDQVSPPSDSPLSDTRPAPSTSHPPTVPSPSRSVGKKAKREQDDDYEPTPKRRMLAPPSFKAKPRAQSLSDSEDDSDADAQDDFDDGLADDDASGEFRPARRTPQVRRKPHPGPRGAARPAIPARRRAAAAAPRRPAVPPKSKSNRGEDYQEGPCSCRDDRCTHCQMTCFYTFVHGSRKGDVCKRLFESGRHLDLRRHKATHAVQEWKWLQDGEITSELAHWHFVVFGGREHGLMCPNGDCTTTFTRYDALKRHMERGTCQYTHIETPKDGLDNRQIKAQVIRESDEKYERVAEAKHT